MRFQTPLVPARLLRRYKRFLADLVLEGDGTEVTAHCPNPGAMQGLAMPGLRCWLEPVSGKGRKLHFGWRLLELPSGGWASIDTGLPNRVVGEALAAGRVAELADYTTLRPEVAFGTASRLDFLLSAEGLPDTYLEVKSVTLCRSNGWAEFPDSVTRRGRKHLEDLTGIVRRGQRAVMLFAVSRSDCGAVRVARDIDPAYARAFDAARAAGVEMLAYRIEISPEGLALGPSLPVAGAPQG